MYKNLTSNQLRELIIEKKFELGELYSKQGLNGLTLQKSQELDILIVMAQKIGMTI